MRIVGYQYRADVYCPSCIIEALPTGKGEAFDGWRDVSGTMSAEENLNEIAQAFGIDREVEYSFDSDDFPKVIFADDDLSTDCANTCGYFF